MAAQFPIVPETLETLSAFQKILSAPADRPIVEMNEETARDMDVIRRSIEALAADWRGKMDCRIPSMPAGRKEFWGRFAAMTVETPLLLPELTNFIGDARGDGKIAIDLGCGSSAPATLLLKRGWKVIAVDNSPSVLDILRQKHLTEIASGQLILIEADATEYTPAEAVDLVVASDLFFYIDPALFFSTWKKVHDLFVKKGGILIGSFHRCPPPPISAKELAHMNGMKEMGAWLLPDRRMVRPLLTHAGYVIKSCTYLKEEFEEEGKATHIQFVAEKKA